MAMKTTVIVGGKPYEINLIKRSKTVWIAVGDYMGERVEAKGTSDTTAAKRWREKAQYMGN